MLKLIYFVLCKYILLFDFIVCIGIVFFEDVLNLLNISVENFRVNFFDLLESGIKNVSNFLEDETLKICFNEVDFEKEKLENE